MIEKCMSPDEKAKKEEQLDKEYEDKRAARDADAKKVREQRQKEKKEQEEKDARCADAKWEELTLCHKTLDDLKDRKKNPYYGATVGRVSGRIQGGTFTIKGQEKPNQEKEEGKEPERYPDRDVRLVNNDGSGLNHLHGG